MHSSADISTAMNSLLEAQREDFLAEGLVAAEVRIDRLERGISALLQYQDKLVDAVHADYGSRSPHLSKVTEVALVLSAFKSCIKHLSKWMKPERRRAQFPFNLVGGRASIEYQPLGVVGVISPWNFPSNLAFGPTAEILAAGNRVMIKPSEYTPATSEVIAEIAAAAWGETEVAIVTGGPDVGMAFSELAFDRLLFTGATSVGRYIMAAAAKNLVPVTLELGGKSPVIIGRSANIKKAVARIMMAKTMNAGQICIAPDYLLVPEEKLNDVVEELRAAVARMYPTLLDNPDYTSVINQRHYDRLQGYLTEARESGAELIECNPAGEDFSAQSGYKIPPIIVKQPSDNIRLMRDEIFGPLLPVLTYSDFSQTIDYVNSKPRPLALYYFGYDKTEERAVLSRTTSGGVTINDIGAHQQQEDLPFGGVGAAGMGAYHGVHGFKTFSHAKAVYRQTAFDFASLAGLVPPYGRKTDRTIKMMTKR